jgi:hypothetical protein
VRLAVIGHYTYFENHFPEHWRSDPNVLCMDVNEGDYSWLVHVHNFRPNVSLLFRPELYPRQYLTTMPGLKIAFLSEPIPSLHANRLEHSDETRLRLTVYRSIAWDAFDWRIYYDKGKSSAAAYLNFPIDEYRPLPIDTSIFRPRRRWSRETYDVCFVGKPTPDRIAKLDFLRSSRLSFIWAAHGVSGGRLAALFQRCRVALNVHADGRQAFEPRVYLAAACGALVLTEPLSSVPEFFVDRVIEDGGVWNDVTLRRYVERSRLLAEGRKFFDDLARLSTRAMISDVYDRLTRSRSQGG